MKRIAIIAVRDNEVEELEIDYVRRGGIRYGPDRLLLLKDEYAELARGLDEVLHFAKSAAVDRFVPGDADGQYLHDAIARVRAAAAGLDTE